MDNKDARAQVMIGKLLRGHYQIVRFLGGGGGGETYVAVDTDRPGQPQCVVKRLQPASNDPNFLPLAKKLFKREAETLEQLGKHDQIPRLLAYFEEEGEFYLVQDFVEGQPLSVELPPGRCWSEMKVIRLLDDILRILEFVHSQGAIHRDVKPANLIRRHEDGKIVLIDFGAVKQISQNSHPQTHINPTTISIGTQGYMSSEQVRGRPRPSSDIYSLGMIGIQALTGIDPICLDTDRNGEVVWQQHIQVSNDLAAVLTKMVREHCRDRYESVAEVLQALQPLIGQKLEGGSDHSETQQQRLNAEETLQSSFRSEPRETKVVDDDDHPFADQVKFSRSDLELRATKVVADDQPDSSTPTPESISEPQATKIADLDQNQSFDTSTTLNSVSEPQATKIEAESRADLQEGKNVELRRRLTEFRNFSMRDTPLVLMAGGIAVVALIGLIWALNNAVKQADPVAERSPASTSENSTSPSPEKASTAENSTGSSPENSPIKAPASEEIYAQLAQYLQQKDWEAADRETYEVILKLTGLKSTQTGVLDVDEWKSFKCAYFQEIDTLWREASDGRLGFGVQLGLFRKIFKQVTGKDWNSESDDKTAIQKTSSVYFDKIGWKPLGEEWRVQWEKPDGARRYQYVSGKEPDFQNPPVGQLPAILSWSDGQDYRLQKASGCKL